MPVYVQTVKSPTWSKSLTFRWENGKNKRKTKQQQKKFESIAWLPWMSWHLRKCYLKALWVALPGRERLGLPSVVRDSEQARDGAPFWKGSAGQLDGEHKDAPSTSMWPLTKGHRMLTIQELLWRTMRRCGCCLANLHSKRSNRQINPHYDSPTG